MSDAVRFVVKYIDAKTPDAYLSDRSLIWVTRNKATLFLSRESARESAVAISDRVRVFRITRRWRDEATPRSDRRRRADYVLQAAIDWADDTGACHFCDFPRGAHIPECPLVCPVEQLGT